MTDPKIDLKTPWVAGLLAYLIPGAGHLYQRRLFKAGVYFVCIFGTFLYGMHLGEWKVVYWTENPGRYKFGEPGKRRSEEHTSELQSRRNLVCRLLLEKKKKRTKNTL